MARMAIKFGEPSATSQAGIYVTIAQIVSLLLSSIAPSGVKNLRRSGLGYLDYSQGQACGLTTIR